MTGLLVPRRSFIAGIAALIAAPAIVRASALMPVKPLVVESEPPFMIGRIVSHTGDGLIICGNGTTWALQGVASRKFFPIGGSIRIVRANV